MALRHTIDFKLNNNKQELTEELRKAGYKKLGRTEDGCAGFRILAYKKKYFELTHIEGSERKPTSSLTDLLKLL